MHMADALISPAVGGIMWGASASLIGYSCKKLKDNLDDRRIPLMGVLGAFVFAAQMINFTIPGTGSSGHLGGGMILAILLGPHAAFLTLASVLTVQALFFADGGLLALGCNIFNLGFFACFIAYPLIFRKMCPANSTVNRLYAASIVSAVVGLQLGAFSVVLETLFSQISALGISSFLLLMQPIHLAIGLVEGAATAAVVQFVRQARPEILQPAAHTALPAALPLRNVIAGLLFAALLAGAILSWFASTHPDGLEWAMERAAGTAELPTPTGRIQTFLAELQQRTALLPDYSFTGTVDSAQEETPSWPAPDAGTSFSGIIGGSLTLIFVVVFAYALRFGCRTQQRS